MTQTFGFQPEVEGDADAGSAVAGPLTRPRLRGVAAALRATSAQVAGMWRRKVAIVGLTESAGRVLDRLAERDGAPVLLLGVFDDRAGRQPEGLLGVKVMGRINDLIEYAREHEADTIILALPSASEARINQILERLRSLPVDIVVTNDVPAASWDGDFAYMAGERLPMLIGRPIRRSGIVAKRLFDIAFASAMLALFAPLLLAAAAAIAIDSPGGALFRQQRIGFNNRPFSILKLRTMAKDAPDQDGGRGALQGDARVTRVGGILRRLSIDELPQLLNVLDGSMSIVGPRPQAVSMRIGDRRYADAVAEYIERHKVKPGLTGLAQVSGSRGGIYTLEKAAWAVSKDLEYIRDWSLWLDLRIIWKTIWIVLSGRGAL